MATNGYARITAGVKLVDINPNKSTGSIVGRTPIYNGAANLVPCCGYKKCAAYFPSGVTEPRVSFYDKDGVKIGSYTFVSANSWTTYFDVPSNAVFLRLLYRYQQAQIVGYRSWHKRQ